MKGAKVLAGLGWSGSATIVNLFAQLLVMGLLARLLDPSAFGLMAMAAIALRFASYFAELGIGQALMQKSELSAQDASAALVLALATGGALYTGVALLSPFVASVFQAPGLKPLLPAVGASLVLSPVACIPMALLRRRAQFARASAIEVAGYVIGYGTVGVACAWAGLGVWSLVLASLGQSLSIITLGFPFAGFKLASSGIGKSISHFWRFGSRYSVIGFLEFVTGNLDSIYIGRWLGQSALGLYNRAQMLGSLPVELVISSGTKVLLPALSTLQHDRERLGDGFLVLLLVSALFSFPLACGIAATHADLVEVLLGSRWKEASPVVAVIAMAVPPARAA